MPSMQIRVFLTLHCTQCNRVLERVQKIVAQKGQCAHVEAVHDVVEMLRCGVLRPPAIAVNGGEPVLVAEGASLQQVQVVLEQAIALAEGRN